MVFDEASGQTHLLDPVKAYILELLSDGPASIADLMPSLMNVLVVRTDEHPQDLMAGALEQLERSHLVEAVSL